MVVKGDEPPSPEFQQNAANLCEYIIGIIIIFFLLLSIWWNCINNK